MNKTDSDKLLEACGQAANAVIGAWSRGASYEGCRDCVLSAILAFLPDERRHADALETMALIEELHAAKIDIEFAGSLMDRTVAGATVSVGARRSGVGGGFRYFHGPSWLDCLRQVAKAKAKSDG